MRIIALFFLMFLALGVIQISENSDIGAAIFFSLATLTAIFALTKVIIKLVDDVDKKP